MIPLALGEIGAVTSGTLHGVPDRGAQVTGHGLLCDSDG